MVAPRSGHIHATDDAGDAEMAALLAAVAQGDRGAAGRFFDVFESEVNRLVYTLLGPDADHDDLVQECFQALFRGAGQVKSVAALRGWVRQVALNTVRMELRKRRWLRFFTTEDEGVGVEDDSIPDEARRERARQTWRTLTRLPTEDRLLLVLRHVEGYELTECAEALGCSLATLKRRLVRADERFHREYPGRPTS